MKKLIKSGARLRDTIEAYACATCNCGTFGGCNTSGCTTPASYDSAWTSAQNSYNNATVNSSSSSKK
ncbi:MAG: hypothetical protein FWD71_08050 [Oscillospiraceae bacterium]|nr:hypothetical protein [Oscillospiraceae bacterium]